MSSLRSRGSCRRPPSRITAVSVQFDRLTQRWRTIIYRLDLTQAARSFSSEALARGEAERLRAKGIRVLVMPPVVTRSNDPEFDDGGGR